MASFRHFMKPALMITYTDTAVIQTPRHTTLLLVASEAV